MNPSRVYGKGWRRVMCAQYAGCLEKAVRRDWPDWTCRHCGGYRPEDRPTDEWWDQRLACLSLIGEVLRGPGLIVESTPSLGDHPQ